MAKKSAEQPLIVLTGGGSGGHITPILAVATELKKQSDAHIVYIGQTGDGLADIPAKHPSIDEVYTIRAGKFRRYHGEGLKQLLDVVTMFKNARDAIYVLIGIVQSYQLLKRLRPEVVFIKGGFVGVPVGLASARLHIPFITHDSDAIPGLANRIIARWARLHAVALPADVYNYPPDKTITTGIPLQADFKPVTSELKQRYREELKLPKSGRFLFAIGGGLGAERINLALAEAMPHLLRQYKDLHAAHAVGRAHEQKMLERYDAQLEAGERNRVSVYSYLDDVYRYSGAADLVITRAGATNLAEFSLQGKACLVIPNPVLTGGHQLKNADYLADNDAIAVLSEPELIADSNRLAKLVSELLDDQVRREKLGKHLSKYAEADAARKLAKLLLDTAQQEAR